MADREHVRRFPIVRGVALGVGGLLLGALLAFLFGLVVMLLWNWLMPEIFGLPEIRYWQGWGLVLMAHILFKAGHWGGDHSRGDREHWRAKMRKRFAAVGEQAPPSPSDERGGSAEQP